jgi:hypothetical protein
MSAKEMTGYIQINEQQSMYFGTGSLFYDAFSVTRPGMGKLFCWRAK